MRFFFTVPFFGFVLAVLIFFYPAEVLSPLHPYSLAAIHLTMLGIITMSMTGALFQMQSVLGGKPIPAPAGNALIIHVFLLLGTLALAGAFVLTLPVLFTIASVLLGIAIVYAANLLLPLLFGSATHDTLRGMRLAIISLAVTALLGIIMASSYANGTFSPRHDLLRTAHYSLGLIGWMGTLIIAVAFQVVEMFYVTTPYSPWCKRNAFRVLAASLLLKILFSVLGWGYSWVFDLSIAALLAGFALTTLKRLHERKRRVNDVSIWFWNTGIALLSFSLVAYLASLFGAPDTLGTLSLIAFALFALSVILGMMGKIVPFLVWFHLSSAGYLDAPIMSNIIPPERARLLFALFSITAAMLLLGVFLPEAFAAGGVLAGAMFAVQLYNLQKALGLYRHTVAHGTRFSQE